jgi:hypothetical protein
MDASRRAEPIKDERGNLRGYSYAGSTIARDIEGQYTVEHDGAPRHFRLLRDALAYIDSLADAGRDGEQR